MSYSLSSKMRLWCSVVILCIIVGKALSVQTECGIRQRRTAPLMRYGNNTSRGKWPWHTAVYQRMDNESTYVCGGTIVSRSHVLTAAHCVMIPNTNHEQGAKNMFVIVGTHILSPLHIGSQQRHNVTAIHKLEDYSSDSHRYDIAMLELESEAIQFNTYVQPICVYLENDLEDRSGMVVGWGFTERDRISPSLKEADFPVVNLTTCLGSNRAAYGPTLHDEMFCAGHLNGTGVCNGDSGGGFFIELDGVWHIAGIVSFTASRDLNPSVCQTRGYAVFTRIFYYLTWLSRLIPRAVTTNYCEKKANNGTSVGANKYPWYVTVFHRNGLFVRHNCGGTLISSSHVLTVAHCLVNFDTDRPLTKENVYAELGAYSFNKLGYNSKRWHGTKEIYIFDNYTWNSHNNEIAVLELDAKATFDEYVQPACLYSEKDLDGKIGALIGWDYSKEGVSSITLRETQIEVVDLVSCFNSNKDVFGPLLKEDMFCGNASISCRGHSGGAFVFEMDGAWFIAGIASFMHAKDLHLQPTCVRDVIVVFTRIFNYLPWLNSVTKQSFT